jgi:FkbM family methyltransferase
MTLAFHSQFGEDRILSEIFAGVSRGTCVEVGANDGINDSNSYHFEKLGWKCILVEPNAELCREIRASRQAQLFECAASNEGGMATLSVAEGAERAHGVSTIRTDADALDRIRSYGFVPRQVQVSRRTLDDILTEAGAGRRFEFLSVDVEGHELEVLQGLDLSKWRPRVVIAEDNSLFRDAAVRELLRTHGYVPFRRTGVNDWYAEAGDRELASAASRWRYSLTSMLTRLAHSRALLPLRLVYRQLRRLRR